MVSVLSNCCGAKTTEPDKDMLAFCLDCKEGCEAIEVCDHCGGENGEHEMVEILGDGDNFECDVIGHKPCPEMGELEDPIQE